jgi:RNA polymerase sigma-70 factor (ECF subfamily)
VNGLHQEAAMSEARTDEAGLAALISAHRSDLRRFLAARCGDPAEAEDLLQELWLKVAALPSGPIANGRAYLFRVANNLVLDRVRARHRAMRRDRSWLDDGVSGASGIEDRPDPAPRADEALVREEEAAVVRRAIAELPPGARRALELHRLEGRGQAEVAQLMGISRSGVEKHLATAMRHLRRTLADCGYFGPAASLDEGQGGDRP